MPHSPRHEPAQELPHRRRDAVLDVLNDLRLTADQKLETMELLFSKELDEKELDEEEEKRTRGTGNA